MRKRVHGSTSLAYNEEASKDDGSCTYPATLKKTLVFKKTATWCGYGTWGTDFSTDLDAAYSNCQIIQLHGDNDFETAVGDQIMDALPSAGWPHFYLGTEDVPNSYSQLSNMVSTELSEANQVCMAMESNVSGSTMDIRVQSKWEPGTSTGGILFSGICFGRWSSSVSRCQWSSF